MRKKRRQSGVNAGWPALFTWRYAASAAGIGTGYMQTEPSEFSCLSTAHAHAHTLIIVDIELELLYC